MIEAAGGPENVTLAELRAGLATGALDIEAPGRDRDAGAGIVMAPAAVAAVLEEDRNRAPTVATAFADLKMLVGDTRTVALGGRFSDPDGGGFQIHVDLKSAAGIGGGLTASLAGVNLALVATARGRVLAAVTATDPDGLVARQRFVIDISRGDRDYDADDDGLVEIGTLAELDTVRYDRVGAGRGGVGDADAYDAAFPEARFDMGCPATGCVGYELAADLDFDTDADGRAGTGDAYWNGGRGWAPIAFYHAVFEGNGHVVRNLFIDRAGDDRVGLFAWLGLRSWVRRLGLARIDVTGDDAVGGLAGTASGRVTASFATGSLSGKDYVGGLVGLAAAPGFIGGSYASVAVSGTGTSIGGLVGRNAVPELVSRFALDRYRQRR